MDQERSSACDRLDRRLGLMRELARSLEQSQSAVVRSDLREMQYQTAQQQKLCAELSQLGPKSPPREDRCPRPPSAPQESRVRLTEGAVSPPRGERRGLLVKELTELESQVAGLNRSYGALLRRASRTVEIFCRVLATSGVTYAPPQPASGVIPGLRE